MERSRQTGETWTRALHVTLLAEVPGVEPAGNDHVRLLDVRLALAEFVMWLPWSDADVQPILVEREPDAPEQVDVDAFRRFAYARNVAVGVSNPLSRQLLGAAP